EEKSRQPSSPRLFLTPSFQRLGLIGLVAAFLGGVLHATYGVAHFAFHFVHLSFRLELLVAQDLAGGFLDGSFGLIGHTLDAILVHCRLLHLALASQKRTAPL